MSISSIYKRARHHLDLQILFPEYCEACHESLSYRAGFCKACLEKITWFHAQGSCEVCAEKLPQNEKCPVCTTRRIYFHKARFLYEYTGTTINLIASAKFKKRRRSLGLIKEHLKENFSALVKPPFTIVQVPSSHNLTSEITETLAKYTNMPVMNLVKRKKARKTKTLSKHQRFFEIENSFEIAELSPVFQHEKILIVDDIFTTGATINFIAKLLHEKLGCEPINIEVFALARRSRSTINENDMTDHTLVQDQ